MKNMKNIVLIIFLCLSFLILSGSNISNNTDNTGYLPSGEPFHINKDYNKKPVQVIGNDIINKLDNGEFEDIEKYIDYLVSEKPYSVNGTRLLEELYGYVAQNSFNIDMLNKWCAKEPSHHSAFIFRGNYYITVAWMHRGGGLGGGVTEDGYRNLYKYLWLAEKDLNRAWSMNPADPNSAASMPTVCTGLRRPLKEMDAWFKKAVTADPVTYSSYANKQNHIRSKWNGSQERDFAFAEDCYYNAPPKSVIHEIMLDYHIEFVNWERKDPFKYFSDPSVEEIIDSIAEKTFKNFPDSVSLKRKLAEIEIIKKNYSKALELYSEILEKDPDNLDALTIRAALYSQMRKTDLARADIEQSIKLRQSRKQRQLPTVTGDDSKRIPEKILSHYTGTYEISPVDKFVFSLFRTRLMILLPGNRLEPLFPESDSKFYNPTYGMFEFFKDDSGKTTHLIVTRDGVEKKARYITDNVHDKEGITLPAEMLSQYIGSYQITPSNIVEVTLEGNQLYAQTPGYLKKAICPESETVFFYRIADAKIQFIKDENGKVTDFILMQGATKVQKGRRL